MPKIEAKTKDTYGPHTVTFLDSSTCPEKYYKPDWKIILGLASVAPPPLCAATLTAGAVIATRCYEDCGLTYPGLENCGWWACA